MQEPLSVVFRNVPRGTDLYAIVSEKAMQLERMYRRIIGCRVVVEKPQKGSEPGGLYRIKVNAFLPRREVVVVKKESRTSGSLQELAALVRNAFKVTGYELERIKRREFGHRGGRKWSFTEKEEEEA